MAYIVGHKCKLCEGALERCRQGHRISIEAIGKYKGYMLCNYCGAHFVNDEWILECRECERHAYKLFGLFIPWGCYDCFEKIKDEQRKKGLVCVRCRKTFAECYC